MCRWMAYMGAPIRIEDLLFLPKHNLIDQSLSSRSRETPTNGDGFGLGWYGERDTPGLFHSIRPAWNDSNLRDLAAHIRTRLFMTHVRATSLATVQETNCHPFRFGKWLFVHNGEIHQVEKLQQRIVAQLAREHFGNILGSTDSELMFHLALSLGLEQDPLAALSRMVWRIEELGREAGIPEAVWMTVAVSDGERIWAVRYASDGEAPTLFASKDAQELYRINPLMQGMLGDAARVIASEPIGKFPQMWTEVPQSSAVVADRSGACEVLPFSPAA